MIAHEKEWDPPVCYAPLLDTLKEKETHMGGLPRRTPGPTLEVERKLEGPPLQLSKVGSTATQNGKKARSDTTQGSN